MADRHTLRLTAATGFDLHLLVSTLNPVPQLEWQTGTRQMRVISVPLISGAMLQQATAENTRPSTNLRSVSSAAAGSCRPVRPTCHSRLRRGASAGCCRQATGGRCNCHSGRIRTAPDCGAPGKSHCLVINANRMQQNPTKGEGQVSRALSSSSARGFRKTTLRNSHCTTRRAYCSPKALGLQ